MGKTKDIRFIFDACECIEDVKEIYRKWAKKVHPDLNPGNPKATILMAALNTAYEVAFAKWENWHRSTKAESANESYYKADENAQTADEYRSMILELIKLDGLTIEICGSWIWISGNTKEHKEALKALGCFYAPKKQAWYWRPQNQARPFYRGKRTMDEIRAKYGSIDGKEAI